MPGVFGCNRVDSLETVHFFYFMQWGCREISDLMINEQIRDKEVRVIGSDGQQLGIMSAREAQKLATEAELDLVKIAPKAQPPVCKIIDYGKYRYEQARKEKEAKKETEDGGDQGSTAFAQYRHQRSEYQGEQRKEVPQQRQ